MATVGRGILNETVFQFYDALRSYDVAKATAALAEDADWESPWSGGRITGKPAIEAHLKSWLGDAKARPSLTISDLAGDGAITRLQVSVSNRFGREPRRVSMNVLCLTGVIHEVVWKDAVQGH